LTNNILEKAFDLGYKKYLQDYYVLIKHTDYPTNKKPQQFVDRILLSKKKNVAIELKKSSTNSVRFRRFKQHQINFLKNFLATFR